jgi:hypothetical protein
MEQGTTQALGGHGTTASAGAKFAIGTLAGAAAVLLPRLLALLSKSDDAQLVFFPLSYFALAAGVGVFLGLVMLVLEYQVATKPKETFMAALGLPAVLSGALGTASTAESVSEATRDADRLRQAVRIEQGIVKNGTFSTLEPLGGPAPAQPADKGVWLDLPFIATAHAGDERVVQAGAHDPLRFGVRANQPKYVVVLKQAANEQQALQDARELQAEVPAARAVRSDKGFFVVLGNAPASETDALLAAARAKKLNDQLQPVLVEVKP